MRFFSPAKINLFLKVLRKRPDGYHDLSSLFQMIDLGDTIDIEPSPEDSLTCTDPSIPTDDSNLVLKATALFRRKTGSKTGFKIHLKKHIPSQAGLGGGSSNAATTLWACNQLSGQPATPEMLKRWAGEIGSDVPVFFSQGTAHCTGRGERVHHLPPLPRLTLWIVKPPVGLSTPDVYRTFRLIDSHPSVSDYFLNDLETSAFKLRPELKILKEKLLEAGFETVLMAGSGSAFFCLGEGQPPPQPDLFMIKARFLNRSRSHWYQKVE